MWRWLPLKGARPASDRSGATYTESDRPWRAVSSCAPAMTLA